MEKGKRVKKEKKKMTKEEIERKKKIITRTFFTIVGIVVIVIAAFIINDFIILENYETTNLVINNKNVTANLKNNILIEDDIIYLSKQDISNFFDKYIYEDEQTNKIITTYEKKIAEIGFEEKTININNSNKKIYASAKKENNITYLPISEMKDVYDVEINYIPETKVVTMDSSSRKQKKAIVTSDLAVKSSTNLIAKTVDRVKKGDFVIVVSSENGYSRIRTENRKIRIHKERQISK